MSFGCVGFWGCRYGGANTGPEAATFERTCDEPCSRAQCEVMGLSLGVRISRGPLTIVIRSAQVALPCHSGYRLFLASNTYVGFRSGPAKVCEHEQLQSRREPNTPNYAKGRRRCW